MPKNAQYSFVARVLHWLVAGMIVAQYLLAELAEYAKESGEALQQLILLANHKSIGMTIFTLAVVRVLWRLLNQPPPLPTSISVVQRKVSHIAHWSIYALIFALPVSGWLMSSANAYSVSWFNVFVFPDLITVNTSLASNFNRIHEILAYALLILSLLHIVAAIKHNVFDQDGVLQRMASPVGWYIFILSVLFVVVVFGQILDLSKEKSFSIQPPLDTVKNPETKLSELAVWDIDYQQSYIEFTGDQAGAPFTGRWTNWKAVMQFDSENLTDSKFDVTINTQHVNSNDNERDNYIVGDDFFDAINFKTAKFVAADFQKINENKFISNSYLSIKGLTKPILFSFTLNIDGDNFELNGNASLERLAWNVGVGDWSDPTWVGPTVAVNVRVVASLGN